MRFRAGLFVGACVGYYYGSKAGRERYMQLNRMLREVKRSDQVDMMGDKARAVVDLTKERAKDIIDTKIRHHDEFKVDQDTPVFSPS